MTSRSAPAATPQADALLELRLVSKSFAGVRALKDVDFDLVPGEVHAIAGENGAGKSTFVNIIAGAFNPDAGTILVHGRPYEGLTPQAARASGIAVVHQEFNLLPALSVAENIFLGALPSGAMATISPRRMNEQAGQILHRLGSNLNPHRLVSELTVAEQQIVEIAKALALDARIIVLDEPSTVLSGEELEVLHSVVRRMRAERRGVSYISHRLDELFRLADRVTVLKDGLVVSTCPTQELSSEELIRRMVGRPLMEMFPDRKPALGPTALEVVDLSVEGRLFGVSLALRRGEIVGVAGLGGSGRTTMARALVGLERISAGTVLLNGRPAPRSPRACARAGLVMVPEDRKAHGVLSGQSVAFNLSLPSLHRLGRLGLLRAAAERSFSAGLIADYGIRPTAPRTRVENLSGGNQQKVVLARWLAREPQVVLLDEPTRGVDVGAKAEIYGLIERLSRTGVSVLFASSELPELIGTCDRIIVMKEGRVSANLRAGCATEEIILRAATSGATAMDRVTAQTAEAATEGHGEGVS